MMPQPTDTASSISMPTWMRRRMSMRSARAPLISREQQKRHPMGDHRESAEGG